MQFITIELKEIDPILERAIVTDDYGLWIGFKLAKLQFNDEKTTFIRISVYGYFFTDYSSKTFYLIDERDRGVWDELIW